MEDNLFLIPLMIASVVTSVGAIVTFWLKYKDMTTPRKAVDIDMGTVRLHVDGELSTAQILKINEFLTSLQATTGERPNGSKE